MNGEAVGVAVIGLRMGYQYLKGYGRNPRTRIVGICDTDPEILARRKEEFGARLAVTDYRELLEDPDIRIVSVVSPDYYHAEQSIAALRAGKDVICEKPLTLEVDEARAIIRAVQETSRKFMVGQVCRYAPGFVLAKRMVDRGDVGELFLVESEYAHNYGGSAGVGRWRVDPRREPFIGGGCHAVDLLRWVAGDAEEVFAYSNHKCLTDWPVDDCMVAVYRLRNDVIGKVMVSIGCVRPYTMRSVFYGTRGTVICDNTSPTIRLCGKDNLSGRPLFATFPVNVESHNVGAEIDEFVGCVLDDKPVVTDVYQGAKTVAACVAAVESARTGSAVKVPQVGGGAVHRGER